MINTTKQNLIRIWLLGAVLLQAVGSVAQPVALLAASMKSDLEENRTGAAP
jgi:hypothetical protein